MTSVRDVISGTALEAYNWTVANLETFEQDFNWLGLAECAGTRAYAENESKFSEENALWAKIAIIVYEKLAVLSEKGLDGFESSAMMLRAYVISKNRMIRQDPFFSEKIIYDWFKKRLPFSYEDAKKLIDNEIKAPTDVLLLRKLKNRISVVNFVLQGGGACADRDVLSWASLWPQLP